jgi:riboflavin transporter FmnP
MDYRLRQNKTKKMAVTAMLVAVAFLVTFLTAMFKVAGFLSLDLKDAVLSMVALMYGPIYGIVAVITVALIEFATIGTTGLYGLVMNILASGTFVLVCGLVYKFKKSFSGAIISAILTVFSVTGVMLIANIFITPLYFQMPRQAIIEMLPTVLLPFNLCKTIMNSSLMLIMYKPLTSVLKLTRLAQTSDNSKYRFTKKSVILLVVATIMLIAAAVVLVSLGVEIK